MRTVQLLYGDIALYFDTIQEAQVHATELNYEEFAIYTLYMLGIREGITWKLQTDTATNLREAKKTRHGTTWSPREIQALKDSLKAGTTLKKIAETLGRSYHATYCKAVAKKFLIKKSRK